MIIEKIEKLSQLSFAQQNQAESKAALQSCFYNLNNLKKIVEGNLLLTQNRQNIKTSLINDTNARLSQFSVRLPQISIINGKNNSILNGVNNDGTSRFLNNSHHHTFLEQLNLNKNSFKNTKESLLKNIKINEVMNKNINDQKQVVTNKQKMVGKPQKQNKGEQKQSNKSVRKYFDIRKRKINKTILGLPKKQRYFEECQVKVPQDIIQKIGLYEAANLYKSNNITKFLKEGYQDKFKPVINLKFATFSLCNRNQFFLTDNSCAMDINEASNYLQIYRAEEQKRKKTDEIEKTKQREQKRVDFDKILQNQKQITEQSEPTKQNVKNVEWVLTIQNYSVVKNQQYFGFKKDNIEDWSEINFILHRITIYLKKVKISLLSFKFQKELFMKQLWSCSRIQQKALQGLLKIRLKVKSQNESQEAKTIRLFNSRAEIIRELVRLWRDRKNLQIMKKNKQKEKDMLAWMCLRMIARYKMNLAKKKAKERARMLNQKLKNGDWDHQIQIHIPSFSESQFVRDTTQYMQHYENMFYHMWKSSNKQFILIIPAINQTILQLLQEKVKLTKNITLICPESHELYPKSLPLSACLLYSKDALCRVKQLLQSKKGIIIPGRQTSNSFLYQYYLSDLLNCPLFSTFNAPQYIGQNKQLWLKHDIPTATFVLIQPKSTIENVIQGLAELICNNQKTKVWILKMNGQFNGRGIAKFYADSSKKIKQILSLQNITQNCNEQFKNTAKFKQAIRNETKKLTIQYLQTHFRLKLKINFENSIFRVEEYIQKFLEKGGVIEEYVEDCQTYQFCYKLQPGYINYSHLYILDELEEEKHICCAQNYEIDFVTKSSIFLYEGIPKVLKDFSKKAERILKSEKFLGYVSIVVIYNPKKQTIYAVQVKPYMTLNSSMSYFIKLFTSKRNKQATNRRNGNLVSNYRIQSRNQLMPFQGSHQQSHGLIFLFIPVLIFTDVDEATRSQVIQSLVIQSWEKISTKLFNQPIVADNHDTFHGRIYISLGLALGLLIYGKPFDLKKMKKEAIDCARELSDKIQSIKLYRGKKQIRDFFQFGDLIRAITKIKS